ncbi:MAG TPA: MarR family winged helix-turn-helix transcriptional regulator [Euzebyales bacterium]
MTGIFDTVGFRIAQVGMRHRILAQRLLAQVGVHPGQEFLLEQLWRHDGLAQTEIAVRAGVEAPTISRMVQRLERAGFVERRADAFDGRIQRVWLTAAGAAARPKVHRAWDELETTALAGLGAADRETLSDLLDRVRRNLQRALDGHAPPCDDLSDDTR